MHQPFHLSSVLRCLSSSANACKFKQRTIMPISKPIYILSLALLASCASTNSPVDVESRAVINGQSGEYNDSDNTGADPEDTSQGLGQRDTKVISIERAEYYDRIANQSVQDNSNDDALELRNNALLSAAENFIQAGNYQRAEQSVIELNPASLSQEHLDRYSVVRAYVLYEKGSYGAALQQLGSLLTRPVETPIALSTQQVDALLLSSFCYQAFGDYDSAIGALASREAALVGSARAETTRYTWQVINSLSVEQKQALIRDTRNTMVRNRVEQSLNGQIGQTTIPTPNQFTQWRDEPIITQTQSINAQWSQASPRSIAVLLPLSSKFTQAANAVRDGIEYQHSLNQSSYRPNLRFYDIGNDAIQAPLYYQTAINNGADMVIGPLGKEHANQIVRFASNSAPTILLGGNSALNRNYSRFTLSPEMEGVRVAEKAFSDGHVTAAVLRPETRAAQRSAQAFNQRWLELGGKLSQETIYSPTQFDHSSELRQLFGFGQSEYRHSQLSATLGFKPKFAAYQRADIDFILLIANNESGRIVRPQINFFSGSKVPVYATSSIFNGIQNVTENLDLNQTQFPVMPWVLRSMDVAPYAGQLNKLYALGSDAYLFAGSFNKLRSNSGYSVNGNTGRLTISAKGEISNQPIWAKFIDGEAVATQDSGYDLSPLTSPVPSSAGQSTRPLNSSNSPQYNDNNWDSRQSRRKVSP